MNIALVTIHTPNYHEMADLTFPGKQEYAKKHGYQLFAKTENFSERHIGMEKCWYMEILMKENPDVDWFWWSGTDGLITNHTIKLESIIDTDFDFIVTKDDNGICADSFLIKNSTIGREYIAHLQEPNQWATEQANMWLDEAIPKWRSITKYLPQHIMNSYDTAFYPGNKGLDVFGFRCNWQPGDFLLHAINGIPTADPYGWKMDILKKHISQVVL